METTTVEGAPETSAVGRMLNIFVAPGDVYAEIKERPVNHANWLVPAVISLFSGILAVFILFSQDWAIHEILTAQQKAMDKGFNEKIKEGKMTQAQADAVTKQMEGFQKMMPMFIKIGGSVATAVYAFGGPFFWGFIIWLVGVKMFKADFEYMKGVEAAGLASIIYALSGIVGVLLSFAMGKLAYVSGAIFLKEVDFTNKTHVMLGAINPFYIWYAAVISLAIAKLAGVSWGKAAAVVIGFWLLIRVILIAINLGQFTM